ncbi:MAG: hypothetical protein NZM00_13815, partial [Anaerolinea sp.]|nr:hypothetical protein [Anaerolinea sp.]
AELERSAVLKQELDSLIATRDLLRRLPELRSPRDLRLTPDMVSTQPVRIIHFPIAAALSAAAAFILIAAGVLSLTSSYPARVSQGISALSTAVSPVPVTLTASLEADAASPTSTLLDSSIEAAILQISPSEIDDKTPSPEPLETSVEPVLSFSLSAAQPDSAALAPSTGAAESRSSDVAVSPSGEIDSAAQPAAIMPPPAVIQAFATQGISTAGSLAPIDTETPKIEPTLTSQPLPTATAISTAVPTPASTPTEPTNAATALAPGTVVEDRETNFPGLPVALIALGLVMAGLTIFLLVRSRS